MVVDLDGTLVQTDMLYESFWDSFSRDKKSILGLAARLPSGKASMKRYLSERSDIRPDLLPYNSGVIEFIRKWRDQGGNVALVTASDQVIAEKIADHLSLFDHVKGSDGSINLKGEIKAGYLAEQFGENSYRYIGDSRADLPVWEKSAQAITITASSNLRGAVEAVNSDVLHLPYDGKSKKEYLRSLRPHQWLKNVLIFLPIIAAHQFELTTTVTALVTFISFSLIASSVYLINDLLDLSFDRAHHRKKSRPLASGQVPILHGTLLAPVLLLAGLFIAYSISLSLFLVVLFYFILTTLYSLSLKHIVIFDILVLAILYSVRIYAGGVATEISLSIWLITFSLFFFFSLAAVKRQAELVDTVKNEKNKIFGRGYEGSDLTIVSMMAMTSGYVSVLVMTLYVNSSEVLVLYSEPRALWGISLVLFFWVNRMVLVTHRGNMHDDPLVYAITDKTSLVSFLLVISFALGGIFL